MFVNIYITEHALTCNNQGKRLIKSLINTDSVVFVNKEIVCNPSKSAIAWIDLK